MNKRLDLRFVRGAEAGALGGLLPGMLVFLVLVPTGEFRARVMFVLQHPRDASIYAPLTGLIFGIGLVLLLFIRSFSVNGVGGVLVGALFALGAIVGGGMLILPSIDNIWLRLTAMAAVCLSIALRLGVLRRRGGLRTDDPSIHSTTQ